MTVKDFSPYIFWSYDSSAEIPNEIIIRQVIAYGEISDLSLLASTFTPQKIAEATENWMEHERFVKRINFFNK